MAKNHFYAFSDLSETMQDRVVAIAKKYPELFDGKDQYGVDNYDRIIDDLVNVERCPAASLTIGMHGKMDGHNSLSGAVQADKTCRARIEKAMRDIRAFSDEASEMLDRYLLDSKNPRHISGKKLVEYLHSTGMEKVCICLFCYADASQDWQDCSRDKFVANSIYYGSRLLDYYDLPTVWGYQNTLRLSAENDVPDVTTARNYIRICRKNPSVSFSIWTKNPGILDKAIKAEGGKPENLIVILSSLYINVTDIALYKRYAHIVDYVFTVCTAKYAADHGIVFNCCGANGDTKRQCKNCMHCYTRGNEIFVYEILR